MADTVVKPDVVLDGQELSAITRLLELLHNNKDVGLDNDLISAAKRAHDNLKANENVVVEDLQKLHEAAKAYQQAVADELVGQFPSVRGDELKKIVKKIEGLAQMEETEDENGNKVHPAALPAGDRPVEKVPEDPSIQKVQIVDPPKDETVPADQAAAKASEAAPAGQVKAQEDAGPAPAEAAPAEAAPEAAPAEEAPKAESNGL